jgi:membrane protein insertase Oxa1/YidC/SpoIIIJ
VLEVLDTLFIQPLMLMYSFVYHLPEYWIERNLGLQLLVFSVLLNLALLPLYYQMEQRFVAARTVREKVAQEVARMKRHFRGRERYFYIKAVYRNYRYHPISEALGSADLLVQILVFVTVYRYLSGVGDFVGQAYGPIADLSRPDGLLAGVNLLPLLMTGINVASVFYYVEDRGKRLQALILALIFLVLLYESAAALVLYWTANNLFSLARNFLRRRMGHRTLASFMPTLARLGMQR